MRYHYEKPRIYLSLYQEVYKCDHPVYSSCTLYKIKENGLAVIQQRHDPETKRTWWTEIDDEICDDLYLHPNFLKVFEERAGSCNDGLYPTMTVRQLMWALRMKPLKKEPWETCFDRKNI